MTIMRVKARIHRWASLMRRDDGIVMAIGVIVLFVVLLVSAAVAAQSLQVSSKSNRDPLENEAIQAGDTGLETALYRLNALASTTTSSTSSTPCPVAIVDANGNVQSLELAGSTTIGSTSWCPSSPQTSSGSPATQSLGNGESFSYQMTPIQSTTQTGFFTDPREIVATGSATGGSRTVYARVRETVGAFSLPGGGGGGGIEAVKSLNVTGGAIVGSTSNPIPLYSNGTVYVDSNSTQCGQISYYVSVTDNSTKCANPPPIKLSSPIYVPAASLLPFTSGMVCNSISSCDAYLTGTTCAPGTHCTVTGSSPTASVVISSNKANVTLQPGIYAMCSFQITGGLLAISSAASASNPVIFYIEPQSVCGSTTAGFSIQGGSVSSSAGPYSFVVEVAGASGSAGSVTINGNSRSSGVPLTVIAPNSTVTINGTSSTVVNQEYVVGNTINLSGNMQFDVSGPVGSTGSSGGATSLYQPLGYTECSAAIPPAGSAPDQNC